MDKSQIDLTTLFSLVEPAYTWVLFSVQNMPLLLEGLVVHLLPVRPNQMKAKWTLWKWNDAAPANRKNGAHKGTEAVRGNNRDIEKASCGTFSYLWLCYYSLFAFPLSSVQRLPAVINFNCVAKAAAETHLHEAHAGPLSCTTPVNYYKTHSHTHTHMQLEWPKVQSAQPLLSVSS